MLLFTNGKRCIYFTLSAHAVSVSVSSHGKLVFSREFQTARRELKLSSMLPALCTAGSQLENIVFKVIDPEGVIDLAFHDDEKGGQSHMLTIKSDFLNSDNSIRYAFRHGCCTVPSIPMPPTERRYCFRASHSRYHKLQMSFEISVTRATKGGYDDEIQSPCSDGKALLLDSSSPHKRLMLSIVGNDKGLEDQLTRYGMKIRYFEGILQHFNDQKGKIEQDMSMLQVSIGPTLLNEPNCLPTKEEVKKLIESRTHSAAAIFCNFFRDLSSQEPWKPFREDIVGPVALLGAVRTNKLTRMLAEYLGEDQMLAVVCKSFETACGLEEYGENGDIDGAVSLDKSKLGRFLVICLEDISPYTGKVEDSDLQRKPLLPDPNSPRGVPSGFMGYAVNMIDISMRTSKGHGIRETLFYRLLGELQVYDTRKNMKEARAYIRHGAISLDGGILRENGIISLGYGNPEICFPVEVMDEYGTHISPEMIEMRRQLEVRKAELQDVVNDIQNATTLHGKTMKKFRKTQRRYDEFLNRMEPMVNGLS